jgi:HNH endonuclease
VAVQALVDVAALGLLDALDAVRTTPAPAGLEAARLAVLAHPSAQLRGVFLRDLASVDAGAAGARSAADLLVAEAGVPVWQARRDAALAARLVQVPGLADAVAGGAVELDAALLLVKAWRALPSRLHDPELAQALITLAQLVDLRDLRAKVDELVGALAPEVTDADLADARESAELTLVDVGARTRLSGECDVLVGELLREILFARAEADRGVDDRRSGPQRAMDALVALLTAAAGTDDVPGSPVLVVVASVGDLQQTAAPAPDRPRPDDALADLFDGTPLLPPPAAGPTAGAVDELTDTAAATRPRWSACSRGGVPVGPRTLAALACQSVLTRLVLSPMGHPLDSSPRARQLSGRERRALERRAGYRCERYGCGRGAHTTVPHHVVPYALGGLSTLGNTVLLCASCHHLLHDRQQGLELVGGRRIGPRGWLRGGPPGTAPP